MIFTLSPALTCGLSAGLGSGEGATGAGVDVAGGFALLFVLELFSVVAGSQAASVSDRSITAKSFFVMIVSIHPFGRSFQKGGLIPSSLGEWEKESKHFMFPKDFFCGRAARTKMLRVQPSGCALRAQAEA
jgi:hypothetical protein